MQNRRNFYRLLQVQPDAPIEVIRASYRTLMRDLKQHPDLGGGSAQAALVNEAYRVLSKPALRAEYDRKLFQRYTKQSLATDAFGRLSRPDKSCPLCKTKLEISSLSGQTCSVCDIPLQPEGTGEAPDRRALLRLKRSARIYFWSRWPQEPQEAQMIDISPRGIRFLCARQIKPGTLMKISGPGFKASAVVRDLGVREEDGKKLLAVGVSFIAVHFESPKGSFLSTLA
jgi:curved DNA-binding protein CbpA